MRWSGWLGQNGRAGVNDSNPMNLTAEERDLVQRLEQEVAQEPKHYDAGEARQASDFWKRSITIFV